MRNSAQEMSAEIQVVRAVLRSRAVPNAIGQDCLDLIELGTADVGADVDHDARQLLPDGPAHEPGFTRSYLKAFLQRDSAHLDVKSLNAARKRFVTGKRKVVGVACVSCPGRFRQFGQPLVESK